jgi:hypothetical protein
MDNFLAELDANGVHEVSDVAYAGSRWLTQEDESHSEVHLH